jgi:hypothetical protein
MCQPRLDTDPFARWLIFMNTAPPHNLPEDHRREDPDRCTWRAVSSTTYTAEMKILNFDGVENVKPV